MYRCMISNAHLIAVLLKKLDDILYDNSWTFLLKSQLFRASCLRVKRGTEKHWRKRRAQVCPNIISESGELSGLSLIDQTFVLLEAVLSMHSLPFLAWFPSHLHISISSSSYTLLSLCRLKTVLPRILPPTDYELTDFRTALGAMRLSLFSISIDHSRCLLSTWWDMLIYYNSLLLLARLRSV